MPAAAAAQAIADLEGAVAALLAALPAEATAKARFAWDDPRRPRWDSGPRERDGLTLGAMPSECRHLAMAVLACVLSPRGLRAALTIMSLERELFLRENRSPRRDPERYYLQLYGTPGPAPWTLRWEGHHLSITVAIADGALHAGPCFRAANPARVPDGPRLGLRPLGEEEDLARALLLALDPRQRALATVAGAPPMDTVTGTAVTLPELPAMGIAAADLTPAQRDLLERLCGHWIGHHHPAIAGPWSRRIAADRDLRFAWQGGTAVGEPHYYRVHGPSLLIEWSNVQNAGNHVHAVLRT
jgi:hypothetical protein